MAKQEDEFEPPAQEATGQSPLGNLPVFKDQPLFADVVVGEEADAFNHAAFAQTILNLIKRNNPPLSIGLFGAWGIGKSTIINILFGKLREFESETFKPIYATFFPSRIIAPMQRTSRAFTPGTEMSG